MPNFAWTSMMDLRGIQPLGIFPSVVKAIQMYHIYVPVMIVKENIQLGGAFSPTLFGPTPIGLVPANVDAVAMVQPPDPFPAYVRVDVNSQHGPNWAMPIWCVTHDIATHLAHDRA
jgi:hypothetical protein